MTLSSNVNVQQCDTVFSIEIFNAMIVQSLLF